MTTLHDLPGTFNSDTQASIAFCLRIRLRVSACGCVGTLAAYSLCRRLMGYFLAAVALVDPWLQCMFLGTPGSIEYGGASEDGD
jgi:hypothetical protein